MQNILMKQMYCKVFFATCNYKKCETCRYLLSTIYGFTSVETSPKMIKLKKQNKQLKPLEDTETLHFVIVGSIRILIINFIES